MQVVLNFIGNFLAAVYAFTVSHLIGALAIVVGGQIVIRILTRTLRFTSARTRVKPALIDLSVASLQGIGILVILSGALQALGLDQIALAIGGSISLIALGVATAASGNLGDIIAGVFLASDPDFGTGFVITTNGITGSIEHVDLRKTRVRTEDGRLHIVPNKSVESNSWIVEHRPGAVIPAPLFRGRGHPNQPGQPPQSLPRPPADLGTTQPHRPPGG